jgi:tRNA (guanine37-N1)-methyltransferase
VNISVLTLFPTLISSYVTSSIIGKAYSRKLFSTNVINIRDFATDSHKSVDDKPYGGGIGMILRVDILDRAIAFARKKYGDTHRKPYSEKVILLDPTGTLHSQRKARTYTSVDHLILVCGHYEGFDARIYRFIDERVSVGRYILTGGEVPALALLDSIVRLLPGVLDTKATANESYSPTQKWEAPQYTRPAEYKGAAVPPVLLSGNHSQIQKWRNEQSVLHKKSKLKK